MMVRGEGVRRAIWDMVTSEDTPPEKPHLPPQSSKNVILRIIFMPKM